jgi:phosphoribosylanthranilate isomerase
MGADYLPPRPERVGGVNVVMLSDKQGRMDLLIKICGLTTSATVEAAVTAGADMIGFMFYPKSPRNVSIAAAAELAIHARGRAMIVAVVVDAEDASLGEIVAGLQPDLLQLHGGESAERVSEIRARFGVPIMKALRIADADDLVPVVDFGPHVDRFLFDAKAPPALPGALPGGNGIAFDWRLVAGIDAGRPTMLSGGLDCGNVAEAIRLTGTRGIDVSSGVEVRPGEKDVRLIAAFIAAARAAL